MEMGSVLACSVVQIMQFRVAVENAFLSDVLSTIGNSTYLSVLGSRLLINLKEAGELGLNMGTSYRPNSQTISNIDFAEGVVAGWYLYRF